MVSKLIIKWSIKPKLFEVKFLVRNEWESVKKETVKDMQTILKFPVQEITGIELGASHPQDHSSNHSTSTVGHRGGFSLKILNI